MGLLSLLGPSGLIIHLPMYLCGISPTLEVLLCRASLSSYKRRWPPPFILSLSNSSLQHCIRAVGF